MKMVVPDFVCIGVPKAGTTWLRLLMAQHPEISITSWEVNLLVMRRTGEPAYYPEYFEQDTPDRKIGEWSPLYGASLHSALVSSYPVLFPHLKFVLVLRDPVERCISDLIMRACDVQFDRHTRTIGYRRRFEDASDTELRAYLDCPSMHAHSDYLTIIDRWAEWQDRIMIVLFDDLVANMHNTLHALFSHVGVAPVDCWTPFAAIPNPNPRPYRGSIPQWIRDRLYKRFAPDKSELVERLGPVARNWIVPCP